MQISPPPLTEDQRKEALKTAAEARRERAMFKEELAAGTVSPADGLDRALSNQVLSKMKVVEFLRALPKVGTARAQTVIEDYVQCSADRRLRGLGPRQVEAMRAFCASR